MNKKTEIKSGFTLVELMVVVAIIGVLAVVAIPNFVEYQAKSKTAEAKISLAAMYTSEQSFFTEYDTYASCLSKMSYDPSDDGGLRYYISGFATEDASTRIYAVSGGADCPAMGADISHFAGNKSTGGVIANTVAFLPTSTVDENTFTAGAGGVIHKTNTTTAAADKWTIDENKHVVHVNTGH